jgi:hypothetical protein
MSENENRELRNSIFSAQQSGNSVPVVSREEYAKRELGIEIPIDAVPLPSGGKVYGAEHPLHNATQIEYRAMTARDEDILMSRALIKKGTVISELIKACLINPGIDVGSLLIGDRNALMIAVRISGYGKEYSANWNCTSCEFKNEINFDLTSLPIKSLELEPAYPGENLFKFKLPVSGKTVGFKFLTGKEEEDISQQMEMRKKKGIVAENFVTTRLLNSIVEFDGNRERGLVSKLVNYMPAKDSLELRKYMEEHEPGVHMDVTFNCKSCDHSEEGALPMGSTFFWPNSRK